MKILFLTNTYPDFDSSYRGIFIKQLALRLQQEGCGVTVVTPRIYRASLCTEDKDGIRTYRFPFFSGDKLLIEYERIPYVRMGLYFLSGVLFTFYVVLKHRCRVIHVHWAIPTGLIGIFVACLLGMPLLVTVHGSDLRMAMKGSGLLKRLFRSVCKRAQRVVAVSEGMKREIENLGISEKKVVVSPMGVNEAFFQERREDLSGGKKEPFVVLSNRNLQPVYNVPQLLEAVPGILRQEPNTKVLIGGEGQEKEMLQRRAQELEVTHSVQFLGTIPPDKMPDLLAKTDVYVSTSLHDGTSVSLLEAMASGAFPVVTDIPANREWIRDGENGFLVPVRDAASLSKKVLEALRSPLLMASGRKINREMVSQRARLGKQARQMLEFYEACRS